MEQNGKCYRLTILYKLIMIHYYDFEVVNKIIIIRINVTKKYFSFVLKKFMFYSVLPAISLKLCNLLSL